MTTHEAWSGWVTHWMLAAAPSDPAVQKSLLDYIAEGRAIGVVIIGLSLVAVALIIAQLFALRYTKLAPGDQLDDLSRMLGAGDATAAVAYCSDEANESLLTRTVGSALLRCVRSPLGFLELRAAVEEIGQQQFARLHRMTEGVGLIASIAPMLGLLGTVVGMVGAFDTISVTEGPVRPDALAGNISEALITTVLGLVVAIPCTAAFTYLRNRVDQLASDVGESIEELIVPLESGGVASASAGGSPGTAARPSPNSAPGGVPVGGAGGAPQRPNAGARV
ncbi:MAG: MotA/TolQ/ExbB proton channel family protein [Planctomycetota bacterium]